MNDEKPWWYPVKCDETYFKALRKDYPEDASMSDEDLLEYYNEGRKYSTLWDHIGDAYEEYVQLADAFLKAEQTIKKISELLNDINPVPSYHPTSEALVKLKFKLQAILEDK